MTLPQTTFTRLQEAWDRFFFGEEDAFAYSHLRIGYALLVLVQCAAMFPTLRFFFGEHGILPYEVSRQVIGPLTSTIFGFLPKTDLALYAVFWTMTAAAALLLLGVFPRVAAILVYVCLASFHHRNNLITDGEDTLFRVIGFLMIFMPLGRQLSFDRTLAILRGRTSPDPVARQSWPVTWRFLQIYMSFMLFCACWWKLKGGEWVSGTAMYYVSRLDDFFGRFPVPAFPFEYMPVTRVITWSVLWVEGLVPFLVWFKETRRYALATVIAFHIGCDYSMNLFLFHWIMILGWTSFLIPDELRAIGARFGRVLSRLGMKPVAIAYDAASEPARRVAAVLAEWDVFQLIKWENARKSGKKGADPEAFVVTAGAGSFRGIAGVRRALRALPAAWWLLPLTYVPGVASWSGWPGETPTKLRHAG